MNPFHESRNCAPSTRVGGGDAWSPCGGASLPQEKSYMRASLALFIALMGAACSGNPQSHAAEPAAAPTALVAKFDPAAGELPEGLAVTPDAAYVGFAPTGRVMRVDVETGRAT